MSAFRRWVRETIARLDGARERRIVALGSMALLLALLFGPWMLHTVEAVANAPSLSLQSVASPATGPVTLQATASNAVFAGVGFTVTPSGGTAFNLPGTSPNPTAVPSVWTSAPIPVEPGRSYAITAQGAAMTTSVPPQTTSVSSNTVTFSAAPLATASASTTDMASGTNGTDTTNSTSSTGSSGTSVTRFAEIVSAVLTTPTGNSVTASGVQTSFDAASAAFHAESGASFSQDFPATRGTDGIWRAVFELPPGKSYVITLVVISSDGLQVISPSRQLDVPVAASPMTPTAPTLAPTLAILFPLPDASQPAPIDLAARISSATAIGVIFEIRDASGAVSNLQASPVGEPGVWHALFSGDPGSYAFSVRASLDNGFVKEFTEQRGFRILETTGTSTANATATGATGTTGTATNTASTSTPPAPSVDLLGPPEQTAPFDGRVPFYARTKDGQADQVVFIVDADAGGETIVLGQLSSAGVWTGSFEGADGGYGVRARARIAGVDTFSPVRHFTFKKIVAAATSTAPIHETPVTQTAPTAPTTKTSPTSASTVTPTTTEMPRPSTATAPTAAVSAPPAMPESLALECRTAGISTERCDEWLKAKYQSTDCLNVGAVTKEDCAALLRSENLPADDNAVYGLASRQDVAQARTEAKAHYNEAVPSAQMPPAIGQLMAVSLLPDDRWRIMPSLTVSTATATAPALLTLDTDGDGLPDDVEKRLGTDPLNPDTDHDGFSDGVEVKNGYNPNGPGDLKQPLRGIDKAMVDGKALEEPRNEQAKVDKTFSIAAEASAAASGTSTAPIHLSGKAAPNSVVSIFVYSYLPVVVTTTTDVSGNWTYDFSSRLADGRHEAYVSVNDDTGKLVAASNPLSFFVKDAQAVSEADFLRPDVNVQAPTESGINWFLIGGGVLILIALILVGLIIRQARKNPVEPGANGPGGTL